MMIINKVCNKNIRNINNNNTFLWWFRYVKIHTYQMRRQLSKRTRTDFTIASTWPVLLALLIEFRFLFCYYGYACILRAWCKYGLEKKKQYSFKRIYHSQNIKSLPLHHPNWKEYYLSQPNNYRFRRRRCTFAPWKLAMKNKKTKNDQPPNVWWCILEISWRTIDS